MTPFIALDATSTLMPRPRRTRRLTPEEFRAVAEPVFQRVFDDPDPFGAPFSNLITSRAIVFPVDLTLEPSQVHALAEAAALEGDDRFFVTLYPTHPEA